MTRAAFSAPSAARQLGFHQLLVSARKTWLMDALSDALGRVDPDELKTQLGRYIPRDVQRSLAAAGVRDEHVFPTPVVLEEKPTLVGYYRLLLGQPQKRFYSGASGMAMFKSMEDKGVVTEKQKQSLPEFCEAMSGPLTDLMRQMAPTITPRDVSELPILTLGAQFQGANNNVIGQTAIQGIFLSVAEIVKPYIVARDEREIRITNSAKRTVIISRANDPDVRIEEMFGGQRRKKVAIEIKGGTDASNAYNRAGEAEKSHQKAKKAGFPIFWTVISKKGLDMAQIETGSPTTNLWFDATEVLAREGEDWEEFRSRFAGEVGIPLG
jgi:XcyI restriction endonuclease